MGILFQDFRSLVQANFSVEKGIARGLWTNPTPSQKIREGSLLDHPRGLERLAPLIINIRGTLIIHIIGHP